MKRFPEPLPRLLAPVVAHALRTFPVVVVTGARQTGKTTLVGAAAVARGRAYRSLDEYDVLDRATTRPEQLVAEAPRMTFDEVQRAPMLLSAIKREVDRDRAPGRYLLTGSANLLVMRRVSETLAGRAVYLNLWPMTASERGGRGGSAPWGRLLAAKNVDDALSAVGEPRPLADWPARAAVGGYPALLSLADADDRARWLDAYVRTYLERDLLDVASVSSLADFRRLMKLAALRIGQVVNQAELARDAGLSHATAHRYLNVLETSFQIVRLTAFGSNRTKRVVKSPKLYWSDTGLAAFLAGDDPDRGAYLENLVLADLLAWRETIAPRPELHFWRKHDGAEVDFIVESNRRLLPVEVKASRRIRSGELKGLETFLDEHPRQAPLAVVLYGGNDVVRWSDRILLVPSGIIG